MWHKVATKFHTNPSVNLKICIRLFIYIYRKNFLEWNWESWLKTKEEAKTRICSGCRFIFFYIGQMSGVYVDINTNYTIYKPTKCIFFKSLFSFLSLMSSKCFEPEGSSSGGWFYIQLWYGTYHTMG